MLIDLCTKHGQELGGTWSLCPTSHKFVGEMLLCTLQSCPVVLVRVPINELVPSSPFFEYL